MTRQLGKATAPAKYFCWALRNESWYGLSTATLATGAQVQFVQGPFFHTDSVSILLGNWKNHVYLATFESVALALFKLAIYWLKMKCQSGFSIVSFEIGLTTVVEANVTEGQDADEAELLVILADMPPDGEESMSLAGITW